MGVKLYQTPSALERPALTALKLGRYGHIQMKFLYSSYDNFVNNKSYFLNRYLKESRNIHPM